MWVRVQGQSATVNDEPRFDDVDEPNASATERSASRASSSNRPIPCAVTLGSAESSGAYVQAAMTARTSVGGLVCGYLLGVAHAAETDPPACDEVTKVGRRPSGHGI